MSRATSLYTREAFYKIHLPYKSQFIFSCHPEGSLCELNSSARFLASGNRRLAEFANRIPCDKSHGARDDGGVVLQKEQARNRVPVLFGGATRNRTGDRGVADLCLTAWPWRLIITGTLIVPVFFGADYGDRTRHLNLGKVALYQMS